MNPSTSVNTAAMNLARSLGRTQDLLGQSLSRLSSGDRIIDPSDDAPGLALAQKLDALARRNQAASTNVQNAISYTQTADGFLKTIGTSLSRLSELSTLALNPLQNEGDRALYQEEFKTLQQQLRDTIGGTTAEIGGTQDINEPMGRFNGRTLFDGTTGVQINVGASATETLTLAPIDLRTGALGALISQDASGDFNLNVDSTGVVDTLNAALQQVASERGTLGGVESRLQLIAQKLAVEDENFTSALSRIRDTNIATESTQMTKYNMLSEVGTSMLTQANQSPQSILRLLQE